MTKNEIRNEQRERRNRLSREEQIQFDRAIENQLYGTELYRSCKRLFIFVSFQSEINTHEIIRQAIAGGKLVYVPKVEAQGMEFYRITGLEGLLPSKFGILEPQSAEADRFVPDREDLTQIDNKRINRDNLMLLPGLAFDFQGNRIGYGAGYYDRYLSRQPQEFYKAALAYDFQVMEHIPAEPFDIKADFIITPARVIECRKQD